MNIPSNEKWISSIFLFLAAVGLVPTGGFAAEKLDSGKWKWDFNHAGDTEGWTIPKHFTGRVQGGALWISMTNTKWLKNIWDYISPMRDSKIGGVYTMDSPRKLAIPAEKFNKVKLRLLNLSPETDGYVQWLAPDEPDKQANIRPFVKDAVHFSMKPNYRQWQEVTCHIDGQWKGTIDQIRIIPGILTHRGDIWIDWIAVTNGPPREPLYRPDLISEKVVPKINIPGIKQAEFQDAFQVLDDSMWIDVPFHGFDYPFFAPGAGGACYGWSWWQLDCNVCLGGAKWANQEFAENVIRGFIGVQAQNPDGRIDHAGRSPVRGAPHHLSSLPRYFEAAYDVARRSNDGRLRKAIFESMRKYHQWWFSSVKRDSKTGLVTAWFEESVSVPSFNQSPQTIAPLDTNVAVALGADRIAKLAQQLGYTREAKLYRQLFDEHVQAINQYMWDEEEGAYYYYNVKESQRELKLNSTTFDPFRLKMAPQKQIETLIPKMRDPDLFNWGILPLTTAAKTSAEYCEEIGGNAGRAWFGNIWTMRNLPIVNGLADIGRHDLAGELAWQTVKAFNGRYAENLTVKGQTHGVSRYCWSASLYIQAIIEYLFGVDYDAAESRLRIMPHIPADLAQETISIENLILPMSRQTRLNLSVQPDHKNGGRLIILTIDGDLVDDMNIEVVQPQSDNQPLPEIVNLPDNAPFQRIKGPNCKNIKGLETVVGVRIPMRRSLTVRFSI